MDFIITHYHGEAKVNDINNDHTSRKNIQVDHN